MEGNPEVGSHRSITEKRSIRFSPSQKVGTDAKSMERPEKSWSIRLLYRTAERIPMGTPTRMMSTMEKTAIRTLVSARSRMTWSTGWWKNMDVPKSPFTTPESQRPYCTYSGRSSPMASRSPWTCSGVAWSPSMIWAGSPGIRWMNENTMIEARRRDGIMLPIRLTI
jgi:hypothetical protein